MFYRMKFSDPIFFYPVPIHRFQKAIVLFCSSVLILQGFHLVTLSYQNSYTFPICCQQTTIFFTLTNTQTGMHAKTIQQYNHQALSSSYLLLKSSQSTHHSQHEQFTLSKSTITLSNGHSLDTSPVRLLPSIQNIVKFSKA